LKVPRKTGVVCFFEKNFRRGLDNADESGIIETSREKERKEKEKENELHNQRSVYRPYL